jgi:ATP-dependent Clp protease ATP-binding subunit ClpC
MYERFTDRARKVMQLANQEAQRFNHEYIDTEHVLLGLIKEGSGTAADYLRNLGVDLATVRNEVEKLVTAGPEMVAMGKVPQTPRAKKVIEYAIEEARNLKHNYVGTEHFLLGLLREQEGVAAQVLMNLNLEPDAVREEVLKLLDEAGEVDRSPKSKESKSKTPALDTFGRDLTDLARQGKLDPVIGRETEIEQVITVLGQRNRNNPLLVGEPGVGRSSIVKALAQDIVEGNVPERLRDRRVVALDLDTLAGESKYKGQLSERLKAMLNETRRNKNVILFVPDLRGLIELDADAQLGKVFRSALSRGQVQCIAVMGSDVYSEWYLKNHDWERWFQTIIIDPPTRDVTLHILRGLRDRYEAHHSVQIMDEALQAAVELSCLYVREQSLPMKAVNLIDEAGARVRMRALARPPDLREVDEQIQRLNQDKEEAVAKQEFERAAAFRDQAEGLKKKKETTIQEWRERCCGIADTVDVDAVAEVVSRTKGIPLDEVRQRKTSSLPRQSRPLLPSLPEDERRQAESILQGRGVQLEEGTGFVLLPRDDEFNDLFEAVIRPAMSANGIVAKKADNIYQPGAILGQVWTQIRTAEVLVADVSGSNPNVIYELGLCFGLHRCPIVLVRDPDGLPLDLRSLRHIPYENSVGGAEELKVRLTRAIEEFLSNSRASRAAL